MHSHINTIFTFYYYFLFVSTFISLSLSLLPFLSSFFPSYQHCWVPAPHGHLRECKADLGRPNGKNCPVLRWVLESKAEESTGPCIHEDLSSNLESSQDSGIGDCELPFPCSKIRIRSSSSVSQGSSKRQKPHWWLQQREISIKNC